MNFFQRRKILRSTSVDDLVPVRVHGHTLVDGRVVILSPKFKTNGCIIYSLLQRPCLQDKTRRTRRSISWECISGEKTVNEISLEVQNVMKERGIDTADAEKRVSKFMSLLYDWSHITFRQILAGELSLCGSIFRKID
ncbi:MAG: hypothetical protein H6540_00140 [Bacteroidales bacterium]|nr:hypothetical protein [Bacteroidales bacterium]